MAEAQSTATVTLLIQGANDAVTFVTEDDENPLTNNDGYTDLSGTRVFSDVTGIITEEEDNTVDTPNPLENMTSTQEPGVLRFVDADADDQHGFNVTAGAITGPSPFQGQASGGTINNSFTGVPIGFIGNFETDNFMDSLDGQVGEVGWTFSVDDAQIDLLSGDQSFTQSYFIEVFENNAGEARTSFTQEVIVTIQGTNDAPVISIDGSDTVGASLVEDVTTGNPNEAEATGTISVTDVDVADTVLQSVAFTSITRVGTCF